MCAPDHDISYYWIRFQMLTGYIVGFISFDNWSISDKYAWFCLVNITSSYKILSSCLFAINPQTHLDVSWTTFAYTRNEIYWNICFIIIIYYKPHFLVNFWNIWQAAAELLNRDHEISTMHGKPGNVFTKRYFFSSVIMKSKLMQVSRRVCAWMDLPYIARRWVYANISNLLWRDIIEDHDYSHVFCL